MASAEYVTVTALSKIEGCKFRICMIKSSLRRFHCGVFGARNRNGSWMLRPCGVVLDGAIQINMISFQKD